MTRPFPHILAAVILLAATMTLHDPVRADGLALFVEPVGGETGPDGRRAFQAGEPAEGRIEIVNRSSTPISGIRVTAELRGAEHGRLDDRWQADGRLLNAAIGLLGPGETATLDLAVRLAESDPLAAPTNGGTARLRVEAEQPADVMIAELRWPIASCADAFHSALAGVRAGPFAALLAGIERAGETEGAMPGRFAFDYDETSGDDGAALRLAAEFAGSRGAEPWLSAENVRWVTWRISTDLQIYLDQERYPGLCTGVAGWADILTENLSRLGERRNLLEETVADFSRRADAAVREAVASLADPEGARPAIATGDADERARALLAASGIDVGRRRGAAVFIEAREALDEATRVPVPMPPEKPTGEASVEETEAAEGEDDAPTPAGTPDFDALARAIGALERLWYLERRRDKTRAVADGFFDTFDAIRTAHGRTCNC